MLHVKTLNFGYYESGFLTNNMLNLRIYKLGLGVFYRWGPYTFCKGLREYGF